MNVRTFMHVQPWTASSSDNLGNAQQTMLRHSIRHLPVLDNGRLGGILSERDVFAARARAEGDDPWWRLAVSHAMSSPVQTAHPEDSLTEVAGRLAAAKIGALPVVELGKLVGLITVTDVLEAEVMSAMGSS
jgi:acetoin utilization protein AcuB